MSPNLNPGLNSGLNPGLNRPDARNAAYGLRAFNVSVPMGDVAIFENARILMQRE